MRPDLHRLARPPRHQGSDARLADAEGPAARRRFRCWCRRSRATLPAARMLAPLATIRDEHRSLAAVIHGLEFLVRASARQADSRRRSRLLRAMLHYIKVVSREAASSEGRRVSVPQAARAHAGVRRDARRARAAACRRPRSSSRSWSRASTATRRIRTTASTRFAAAVDALRHRPRCSTWRSRRRSSCPRRASI